MITGLLIISILLFLLWLITCMIKANQLYNSLLRFNDEDWHVDKLPKPTYVVNIINAIGLGCGSSCFISSLLFLINRLLVRPALKMSLKVMVDAEESGTIDPILCNKKARDDMELRVQDHYDDIYNSTTMNVMSKLLNYGGTYQCLSNHSSLLKLGMSAGVASEKVSEPVFIVSFPRTGTTILHRTMALDRKRFRNFDLCDMISPLPKPVPRWDMEGRKQKAVEGNNLLDQMKAVFPGYAECLETMHGFRSNEAEEDLGWYDTGLGHMYMDPLIKLHLENRSQPEGMSKLESKDVAKYRYAWLAMIMKLYQHTDKTEWEKHKAELGIPGEDTPLSASTSTQQYDYNGPCPTENLPWLMKDPNHSAYLPELLSEFPDAKFIFTHRAPAEIIPSMAKLFVILTSVEFYPYAPGSTSKEWGVEVNLRMKHYCDGLVQFTKNVDPTSPLAIQKVGKELDGSLSTTTSTRRIDMFFKNLVTDVPGSICGIYKQFYPDQPIPSDEAMEAFKIYLEKNEREKHGNQRRSLEDFHLTKDDVSYSEYHELFLDVDP